MTDQSKSITLTKAGAAILVVTLILSILFIVWGIVILTKDGNQQSGGGDIEAIYVSDSISRSISTSAFEYYDLKFVPNSSGKYRFNLDGATISSIKTSYDGVVTFDPATTSSYDNAYHANLIQGSVYTIRIYTRSDYVYFYAFCDE